MKFNRFGTGMILSLLALSVSSCSGGGASPTPSPETSLSSVESQFLQNYANIVLASYEDTVNSAGILRDRIATFTDNPNESRFNQAKEAWLAAREPYGQTEAYRFYDGPIDNGIDGPEAWINSWPLDENHIDYTQNDPLSGLINSGEDLNTEVLASLNQQAGETAVLTGYHAIEFLLWGQDLNNTPTEAGLRPYTDYVDGGTAENQDRRRLYLNLASELLISHLDQVAEQWNTNLVTNFRSDFLSAENSRNSLSDVIHGIGSLAGGELSSERMNTALFTKTQEDEHSCFSDNTHRDILNNFQGIKNVYFGSYQRIDGSRVGNGIGLEDIFALGDPEGNQAMLEQLAIVDSAIAGIVDRAEKDQVPFDQQVTGDFSPEDINRIQTAIDSLRIFSDLLAQSSAKLNIDIELDADGE